MCTFISIILIITTSLIGLGRTQNCTIPEDCQKKGVESQESHKEHSGWSDGTIAGVAVGASLLGLLLIGLSAYYIFARVKACRESKGDHHQMVNPSNTGYRYDVPSPIHRLSTLDELEPDPSISTPPIRVTPLNGIPTNGVRVLPVLEFKNTLEEWVFSPDEIHNLSHSDQDLPEVLKKMGLDLYYTLFSPPSRAVMILAKELGLELNLINVNMLAGDHKKDEYAKLNPMKQVPTLVDGDFVLAESRAILMYLVNQYSPGNELYPTDPKKKAKVDRILFLTNEMFQLGKRILAAVHLLGKPMPEDLVNERKTLLKVLDELIVGPFLTGDKMTIADISAVADITVSTEVMGSDVSSCPKVVKWLQHMKDNLPEYEELIAKPCAGFKALLAERMAGNK